MWEATTVGRKGNNPACTHPMWVTPPLLSPCLRDPQGAGPPHPSALRPPWEEGAGNQAESAQRINTEITNHVDEEIPQLSSPITAPANVATGFELAEKPARPPHGSPAPSAAMCAPRQAVRELSEGLGCCGSCTNSLCSSGRACRVPSALPNLR